MPRTAPAQGKAHVVVSVKHGGRYETAGELPEDQALTLIRLAAMPYERFAKLKAAMDAVA